MSIDYLCFSKCELVRPRVWVDPASSYPEAERVCLAVSRIRQRSFRAVRVREPSQGSLHILGCAAVVYDWAGPRKWLSFPAVPDGRRTG